MVKVLGERVTTKQCDCRDCGALLEYKKSDVKTGRYTLNEYYGFIECPFCGNEIVIRGIDGCEKIW